MVRTTPDPYDRDRRDINCPDHELAPRGRGAVFTEQANGFWTDCDGLLHQAIAVADLRLLTVWTLEFWLGCLLGKKCKHCYVPAAQQRHGWTLESHWFREYGAWLMFKTGLEDEVRRQLTSERTATRSRWLLVYACAKTEPLLTPPACQEVACRILEAFLETRRPFFLLLQTRMNPLKHRAFPLMQELGRRGRLGFSISLSTDEIASLEGIEQPVYTPEERLAFMRRLKEQGFFVSAAVAPVLPYSNDFARKLVPAACHASIQELHEPDRSGAATAPDIYQMGLDRLQSRGILRGGLERRLADELLAANPRFTWGVGPAGFRAAYLAALRHNGRWAEYRAQQPCRSGDGLPASANHVQTEPGSSALASVGDKLYMPPLLASSSSAPATAPAVVLPAASVDKIFHQPPLVQPPPSSLPGIVRRTSPTVAIPPGTILVTAYEPLDRQIANFPSGEMSHLLLGLPGVQKSRTIKQLLGERVHHVEGGHFTPVTLYRLLQDHRNDLIVLDDLDSELFQKPATIAILKQITAPAAEKTVTWQSSWAKREERLEPSFRARARLLIVANSLSTPSTHLLALTDRCYTVWFHPSPAAVHERTSTWFQDPEIYEFIGTNLAGLTTLSMRVYERVQESNRMGHDWRDAACQLLRQYAESPVPPPQAGRLLPPASAPHDLDPYQVVLAVDADPSLPTPQARIDEFCRRTNLSPQTYYRRRGELETQGLVQRRSRRGRPRKR